MSALRHLCLAHKEGREMELPKKAEKKKRRIEKRQSLYSGRVTGLEL